MSNLSQFAEYIIDSVRSVQQNSRHLVAGNRKAWARILAHSKASFFSTERFSNSLIINKINNLKFYTWRKKSIAVD